MGKGGKEGKDRRSSPLKKNYIARGYNYEIGN